jgi:hypothetical protein
MLINNMRDQSAFTREEVLEMLRAQGRVIRCYFNSQRILKDEERGEMHYAKN